MKNTFTGQFTSAAGALEDITLGCEVSYVKVYNVTTNISYELFNDGTNTEDIITTGATGVITTGGANIVAGDDGFSVAAAALSTDDVCTYVAHRLA